MKAKRTLVIDCKNKVPSKQTNHGILILFRNDFRLFYDIPWFVRLEENFILQLITRVSFCFHWVAKKKENNITVKSMI